MDSAEIASLVRGDRVHSRVYTDPAIFDLELKRLWGRAWVFVGHDSQIPKPGDYFTSAIGKQPILVVRTSSNEVAGFFNRCPHRGSLICNELTGHAKTFACPYHGWAFKISGELLGVPFRDGYSPDFMDDARKNLGLARLPRLNVYRGFIFASLASDGVAFDDFMLPLQASIDNLLDRTPEGALEVKGLHRYGYKGNWKLQIENALDEYHPLFAHASTIEKGKGRQIKRAFGDKQGNQTMKTPDEDVYKEGKSYFDRGGVRGFDYGQAYLAISDSSWAGDLQDEGYRELLLKRHGEKKLAEIQADTTYENAVFYPNLIFRVTGNIHLRVVKPIAVDQSEVWVWPLVPKGAPEYVEEGILRYANMHTSPASLIQTDDLEIFERVQIGMEAQSPEWIMLARGFGRERPGNKPGELIAEGTWETGMRAQFKYWHEMMTAA